MSSYVPGFLFSTFVVGTTMEKFRFEFSSMEKSSGIEKLFGSSELKSVLCIIVIKFKFLLFINNFDQKKLYFNEKQITTYFNMIRGSIIKEKEISSDIIDQLVVRYEIIYFNEEKNNIMNGLYNIKKLATIIETFCSHYAV